MKNILVSCRDQAVHRAIRSCFNADDRIRNAGSFQQTMLILKEVRFDFVFVDLGILSENTAGGECREYKDLLKPFWALHPSLDIVIMAPQESIRKAVAVVKAGARDYLTYPIDREELHLLSESILESNILQSELSYLRDQFWQSGYLELVKTGCPNMQAVFGKIRSVAPTRSNVLLIGETGTGKTLMAKLIHHHSNRKDSQFISVHCGAIPDTLIESELFGHEKGAFTGAIRRKLGKFEIAKGGTIFMDEIGTVTPAAQIKLLQVLQDGTFQRLGGEEDLHADARVIAASNIDLKQLCDDGSFRKDLYYRLNVFPIEIPPLRERLQDIPYLCDVLLRKLRPVLNKEIAGVHPLVLDFFSRYSWPGNIRELENLLERAAILETSTVLTPESFPAELFEAGSGATMLPIEGYRTLAQARLMAVEEIERRYLKDVLARNRGKINDTAKEAGITTRQLNKLMNKYALRKEEFKQPS
jgi:DNA-binding NtrC family response regulator